MDPGDERPSALLEVIEARDAPWRERAADRWQLLLVIAVIAGVGLFIAAADHWGYSPPKTLTQFDAQAVAVADSYARAVFVEHDCAKATRLTYFKYFSGTPPACEFLPEGLISDFREYNLVRGSRRVEEGCCIRYQIVGTQTGANGKDYWIIKDIPVDLLDLDPPRVGGYGGYQGGSHFCPKDCKAILARRIPFTNP